jgi:hypothetical protein
MVLRFKLLLNKRLLDIFNNESLYHWSPGFCRYFELLFFKLALANEIACSPQRNKEWY